MGKITKIAILGFADSKETDREYKDAFETAKLLAQNEFVVIDGGGPGVMRAATLGAHSGGGKAIGITYYPDPNDPQHPAFFEGRDKENTFDEEIRTTTYVERTLKIMEEADLYIVFNGGTGTISELGMAWGLARLHFGKHKPLILFGSWWHEVIEAIGKNMRLRPEELQVYHIVDSAQEVILKIKAIEENGK
jgi:uncharacterized protein (TIGR00725 family)